MPTGGTTAASTGPVLDGVLLDQIGASLLPIDDYRFFFYGGRVAVNEPERGQADPVIVTFR